MTLTSTEDYLGQKYKIDVFRKKSCSLEWGMVQTNQVYSNGDQRRVYQNCKFHDPQVRDSGVRV